MRHDMLPPPVRAAGVAGAARVLFLHVDKVGFATTMESLKHYAGRGGRDDIDAVHVTVSMPGWLRLACARPPREVGGWDFQQSRMMWAWERRLRGLIGWDDRAKFPLKRFDVVHVMTQQRARIVRRLVKTRPAGGARFMVNIDATLPGWDAMRGFARFAPKLDYAMERKVYAAADALAVSSRWVERSALEQCGVEEKKIVVHMPCARGVEGRSPDARRKAGGGGKPRIVFVGNDWENKGGPRLLRWHQERWADKAELHIVGRVTPEANAKAVTWHGKVEHETLVKQLLPAMDIFCVPTRWDTFLIAAQEAQAVGIPVVTSRTGALNEVVLDQQTGFLCGEGRDTGDAEFIAAVEKLLADAALRDKMGRAAMQHAARDLEADVWHNHLLDQIVALANVQPISRWPRQLSRGVFAGRLE